MYDYMLTLGVGDFGVLFGWFFSGLVFFCSGIYSFILGFCLIFLVVLVVL